MKCDEGCVILRMSIRHIHGRDMPARTIASLQAVATTRPGATIFSLLQNNMFPRLLNTATLKYENHLFHHLLQRGWPEYEGMGERYG
jgi:hypothetical protein